MKSFIPILIILSVLIPPSLNQKVIAQAKKNLALNSKSIGGFTSYGVSTSQFNNNLNYNPVHLGVLLHYPLKQSLKKFNLSINALPHFGMADFRSNTEFELGLNMILELSYRISTLSSLSINIGSGPHYISAETEQQANGFIFSDMSFLSYKKVYDNTIISIFSGYRHISNAGLKTPNAGINNFTAGFMISKPFKKK